MKHKLLWSSALLTAIGNVLHAQSRVQFIAVDSAVKLEVLDWGGSGRPVVLLAGNTRTAHDFDDFAPRLTSTYHVYGITRRGFGASSAPATGYLADRLADDVLAVVDSLKLSAPVLAGHSLAGEELSSIGSRHPERVAGLVYLDAAYAYAFYDTARGDYRIDSNELRRSQEQLQLAASNGSFDEVNRLMAQLLDTDLPALQRDLRLMRKEMPRLSAGPRRPLLPPSGTGIARAINEGMQRFTTIRAPILTIYALGAFVPADIADDSVAVRKWVDAGHMSSIKTLERDIPTAHVVLMPHGSHDVFRSDEADVLREMRAFIGRLPMVPARSP